LTDYPNISDQLTTTLTQMTITNDYNTNTSDPLTDYTTTTD